MTQEFSLVQETEVIEHSLPKINKNFETLRSGFSGTSFPTNPTKGQHAFINDAWHTYSGTEWIVDDAAVQQELTGVQQQASNAQAAAEAAQLKADTVGTTAASNAIALSQMQTQISNAIADIEAAKNDAAAAKAQAEKAIEFPVGTEVVGEWRQAPAGCLALFGTRHSKAAFPDLWQHAVDQNMVISKTDYDWNINNIGSCGYYYEDPEDSAYFYIPLQQHASTPVIEAIAGAQVGDGAFDSLPEIAGEEGHHSNVGATLNGDCISGSFTLGKAQPYYPNYIGGTGYNIIFKASASSPVYGRDGTDEARIRRIHKLYCVKAYDVVRPAAAADMAAMTGDIQKLQVAQGRCFSADQVAMISDIRTTAYSGASTANAWTVRPLNTVDYNNIPGLTADFSNSSIHFPIGTYLLDINVAIYTENYGKFQLFDLTNSKYLPIFMTTYANTSHGVQADVLIKGILTVTSPIDVQVQQKTTAGNGSYAFGVGMTTTDPSCFTKVTIMKTN